MRTCALSQRAACVNISECSIARVQRAYVCDAAMGNLRNRRALSQCRGLKPVAEENPDGGCANAGNRI